MQIGDDWVTMEYHSLQESLLGSFAMWLMAAMWEMIAASTLKNRRAPER